MPPGFELVSQLHEYVRIATPRVVTGVAEGDLRRRRMKTYVKPTLTGLGLLRLVTQYSCQRPVFEGNYGDR